MMTKLNNIIKSSSLIVDRLLCACKITSQLPTEFIAVDASLSCNDQSVLLYPGSLATLKLTLRA